MTKAIVLSLVVLLAVGASASGQLVAVDLYGTVKPDGFFLNSQYNNAFKPGDPFHCEIRFDGGVLQAIDFTAGCANGYSRFYDFTDASSDHNPDSFSLLVGGGAVRPWLESWNVTFNYPTAADNFRYYLSNTLPQGGMSFNASISRAIPGDANSDGRVDDNDLNILLSNWGAGTTWAKANFKGNGVVDDNDLNTLLSHWNGTAAAVPEPATLGLLALGAIGLFRNRRMVRQR